MKCSLLVFLLLFLPKSASGYPSSPNTAPLGANSVVLDYSTMHFVLTAELQLLNVHRWNNKQKFATSTPSLGNMDSISFDLNVDSTFLEVSEEEFDDSIEFPRGTASFSKVISTDIQPVFRASLLRPILDMPPETFSMT